MTSVHSVHTNNGEGEFFFAPKYIIWDPGGSKKQTDAIVASGMSFRSGWVLTKSSNSTVCQKYGKNTVLTVADPTLKTKKNKNKKKKRHESIGSLRGDSGTSGGGG